MNKYIKAFIVIILLPVAVVTPIYLAQTMAIDAHATAQQTNLQQRVEQYKTKLRTPSSKSDLEKLKLRCNVAQERLKALSTRVGTVQEKRTTAYTSINKTLEDLNTALKVANVTTATLETQSKELKAKTDAFATDFSAYKQAVEDSAAVDCAQDPLAMKSAIEEARNYHTKLVQEVADIRIYINNVIKTTLKKTRDDLSIQQSTSPNPNLNPSSNPNLAPDKLTPEGGTTGATRQ